MNPEGCKFVLDITPNFAYVSLGGILYKMFYSEHKDIDLSVQQAADLIIKANGVVVKCRYDRNSPYIADCVSRIRSMESLPELHLTKTVFITDFVNEKKKAFHEIQRFLKLTQ